jgi:hypothetical protein
VLLAQRDEPLHPPQERTRVVLLGLDVDRLVVVLGIDHHRQDQALRVRAREAGVAIGAPLHGRAHAVAVAEEDVVAHGDLVAVVDDGRARHREQEAVEELHRAAVVAAEGSEAAADAEVDAHRLLVSVGAVHVVPLLVGDHLERELVVVAQEERPLAGAVDLRRLRHDVQDGEAILHVDRHVHPRHEREVEVHVALVALAEVGGGVLGPLVGFGEQHARLEARVHVRAQLAQELVGLRQVLAVRPLGLVEVRHGVEAHPVDAHAEPEVHHAQERLLHVGVLEVEVGLVRVEAVPEVLPRDGIPRPVRRLEVLEDDTRLAVPLGRVAPHVEAPLARAGGRAPGPLEPRVLIGGVVEHELGDHAQAALVRLVEEEAEVVERAELGVHVGVVGDVVAVVALGRGIERQEPQGRDAEVLQIVELGGEAAEIADAVAVGVIEGSDAHLVDDRVLVPVRIANGRLRPM